MMMLSQIMQDEMERLCVFWEFASERNAEYVVTVIETHEQTSTIMCQLAMLAMLFASTIVLLTVCYTAFGYIIIGTCVAPSCQITKLLEH